MEPLSLPMHLSATNNSFAWEFKREWLATVIRFAAEMGRDLKGANLLEVGAGVHNPLGCALAALGKGASFAVAVEPGDILPEHLDHAILLGLIAYAKADTQWPSLQSSLDHLMDLVNQERRSPSGGWVLQQPAFQLFRGIVQDYQSEHQFDIIHSNAVMEHVLDLNSACAKFYDLTAMGGVHVHKVDFIDHRYYEKAEPSTEDAFRFLLVGQERAVPECSGARMSEVITAFTKAGFEFVDAPEHWQLPFPEHFLDRLQRRYRDMSRVDLQTTCATLLFRKPVTT
jgi:hypothetical protein